MVAGAVSPWSVGAQQLLGTVTGKLTDTHSSPLENVSVTLRNIATGAAITSTTSRGGRYSFKDLAGGEYTLAASGSQGDGEVGGIVVSPGHESRVQAVIEFQRSASSSRLLGADLSGNRLRLRRCNSTTERCSTGWQLGQ